MMCPVCGCELGTGQMVGMQWADRIGEVVDCVNCLAFHASQLCIEAVTQ